MSENIYFKEPTKQQSTFAKRIFINDRNNSGEGKALLGKSNYFLEKDKYVGDKQKGFCGGR